MRRALKWRFHRTVPPVTAQKRRGGALSGVAAATYPRTMTVDTYNTTTDRLLGLDAVRAFALLGITLVNVTYFAQPSVLAYGGGETRNASGLDSAAEFLTSAFCEMKFFPLFSLLFGMGLMLMADRGRQRGQRTSAFVWMYLRRLAVLAVIGAMHATIVWYGDILFIYAFAGLALLAFHWIPARAMLVIGMVLLAGGVLISSLFMALSAMDSADKPLPADLAALPPVQRFVAGLTAEGGVHLMSAWKSAEIDAFSRGPYLEAVGIRVMVWIMSLLATGASFGWIVLGMFFLGAGLAGSGFFRADHQQQRRLVIIAGLGFGLPVAVLGAVIGWLSSGFIGGFASMLLGTLAGAALAVMWAAVFASWAIARPASRVLRFLAVPGRMGLTNYLLISLLGAAIWQHWGLGLFGTTTPAQEFAIALGLFIVAVAFSHLWMRAFTSGPIEWVWRCATNLELRPLLLSESVAGAARA